MVSSGSFCLLVCSFLLLSATCYEAFFLHVVSKLLIQFPIYQYARVYFPEDRILHQHRREILKSPVRFNISVSYLQRPVRVDGFSIRLANPAYETLYVAGLRHVHSITMIETVLTLTDLPTY